MTLTANKILAASVALFTAVAGYAVGDKVGYHRAMVETETWNRGPVVETLTIGPETKSAWMCSIGPLLTIKNLPRKKP